MVSAEQNIEDMIYQVCHQAWVKDVCKNRINYAARWGVANCSEFYNVNPDTTQVLK